MLERFSQTFEVTAGAPGELVEAGGSGPVAALAARFGGCTFRHGLYRVHTVGSAVAATELVTDAFGEFGGRISCFGFDWLGRQFAADATRGTAADPEVLMFEPGTGEALEIPVPFTRFHDEELVDFPDEALAAGFFDQWRATQGAPLAFDACVGYRTPLFLGGTDDVSNLELSDLDVYWTIMGQLRQRAAGQAPGTPIGRLRLEDS